MAFSLVSVPLFDPVFLLDKSNSWIELWKWVGTPILQPGGPCLTFGYGLDRLSFLFVEYFG